jgi:hypothetical protein
LEDGKEKNYVRYWDQRGWSDRPRPESRVDAVVNGYLEGLKIADIDARLKALEDRNARP